MHRTSAPRPLVPLATAVMIGLGSAMGCAKDGDQTYLDSGPPDSATDGSDSAIDPPDAAETDPPDVARTESRACPGGLEPGPTGLVGLDLARDGFWGDNELTAVFCNPLMFDEQGWLVFYLVIVNHLDGLPPSDITSSTFVEASDGLRSEGGFVWDGDTLSLEDHHVDGHLIGPLTTPDGAFLIGPETSSLSLHVRGIGSQSSDVVFRWERPYLP